MDKRTIVNRQGALAYAAVLGLTLSGCVNYPQPSYRSDGGYDVTPMGRVVPATMDARTVATVPQKPRDEPDFVAPQRLKSIRARLKHVETGQARQGAHMRAADRAYKQVRQTMIGDTNPIDRPEGHSPVEITIHDPPAPTAAEHWLAEADRKPSENAVDITVNDRSSAAYEKPSKHEIDERTKQLMLMAAQVRARRAGPLRRSPSATVRTTAAPPADTSPLKPLPGLRQPHVPISQVAQGGDNDANASAGALNARYNVSLEFDATIPMSRVKALLGEADYTIDQDATGSGKHRVSFGSYASQDAAKSRCDAVEHQVGLRPTIKNTST